ncbi:glycosyltransferase [Thermanaeromonas toyohensis]|nr:glycosyltransferase [Thermanaeromonas toyohensis]
MVRYGIIWEGSFFVYHSLALVNRELVLALLQDEHLEIGIKPYEPDEFETSIDPRFALLASRVNQRPAHVDFTVRHRWPPLLSAAEGRLIWIQPWEYGSLPVAWVRFANSPAVTEVWVPSSFVRETYIQSGVDPEKVKVVPNGVNTQIFHPEVPPLSLPTRKGFKFLFAGGTIPRKGPDVLLKAYLSAFSDKDDVCLVIKDFGTNSFYRNQGMGSKIKELQGQKGIPEILYLEENFNEREMAALYCSCNCLVHPYRGEGFGLPILEAMACGLPVIVTGYGACLDFCHEGNALLIRARLEAGKEKRVGELETVSYPYWAEPDVEHLIHLLRWVYENLGEARVIGSRAAEEVARRFNWNEVAAKARTRFDELKQKERTSKAKFFQNSPEELLQQGVQAYTSDDKKRAEEFFQKVLEITPDNPEANYNLGVIHLEKRNFESAARYLINSLKSDASSPESWAALGSALAGLGDYGAAEIAYETAFNLKPDLPGVAENLATVKALLKEEFDLWASSWYRVEVKRLAELLPKETEKADVHTIIAAIAHAFEGNPYIHQIIREEILPHFEGCQRILDVGCGEGIFLEMLREIGAEGEGIDIDPVVVKKAQAKGLRVQVASALDFLQERCEEYDGIMLGHIIEHFSGPEAVKLIYYCSRALKEGGVIVIRTPNFTKPEVCLSSFWLDISHVRPYPLPLLEIMLKSLGFKVLYSGTMPSTNEVDILVVGQKGEKKAASQLQVIWRGHFYDMSGYGDEARGFVFALSKYPLKVKTVPIWLKEDVKGILTEEERRRLRLLEQNSVKNSQQSLIVVHHLVPAATFGEVANEYFPGAVNIQRIMFETDRIPEEWVDYLNRMDEIWVPSQFNVETFSASGVREKKLKVVPGGIDPELFSPQAEPLDLPVRQGGFIFLSVLDWIDRKGWDVLLTAYLTEFKPQEEVVLLIKASRLNRYKPGTLEGQIYSFIRERLGLNPEKIPKIALLKGNIEYRRMPSLYMACHAFVLPSRGEGWGRPYLEAMACGLPTIGTKWSGNLEFMTEENSFLIEIEGLEEVPNDTDVPLYWGHRWAKPSVEHLRQILRYVFEHQEEAQKKGKKARQDVLEKWTWEKAAEVVLQELQKYTKL